MSYYTKSNYNNKPYKKPKTVSFDEPDTEEEEEYSDIDLEEEEQDTYGESILQKLAELGKNLDNILELVKQLKQGNALQTN